MGGESPVSPVLLLVFGAGVVGRYRGPCTEPALCAGLAGRVLLVLWRFRDVERVALSPASQVLFTGAIRVQQAHPNLVAALHWARVLLF